MGRACPVCCVEAEFVLHSEVAVNRCGSCGHVFVSLEERMGDALEDVYSHPDYGGFRDDPVFRLSARRELERIIGSWCPPPARLLDVGCGNGIFLEEAAGAGYEGHGIDVSDAAVSMCAERGLSAEKRRVEDEELRGLWDVVTMWDVIEHVMEPLHFVEYVKRLVRPGGIIFLKTPTVGSRTLGMLRVMKPLARSTLQLPEHVNIFSERSMSLALEHSGLQVVCLERRGSMRKQPPPRSARKVLGRIGRFPVKRFGDMGNLLVVARHNERAATSGE